MPHRGGGFFHLHLVSDATGETLITVARAAAAQYASVSPIEHIYPLVRTDKQMERVISEIEAAPGIVLYTMLDSSLAERLQSKCREFSIPCLSILDPVLGQGWDDELADPDQGGQYQRGDQKPADQSAGKVVRWPRCQSGSRG